MNKGFYISVRFRSSQYVRLHQHFPTISRLVCVAAEENGKREPLIVDSIRYAGNDFLMALADDEKGGKISTKPLIELQRRIRAENQNLLEELDTFNNSKPQRDEAKSALDRFLRGLTQYLARLLAVRVNQLGDRATMEPLNIYLLGNG